MARGGYSIRALPLLSLMTCLAIAIATTVLILDLRERGRTQAQGAIIGLSRVLSDQTTRTFDGVLLTMRAAREYFVSDIDRRLELDAPAVHELLRARVSGLPQVKSLFVTDHQGEGVNSSRSDFIRRLRVTDRPFFRYHADGGPNEVFISAPEMARVDGQWTFYVSIPLRDLAGRFRGVLAAAIRIDHFEALYEAIDLHSVSQVLLLDNAGARLAGSPSDERRYGQQEGEPTILEKLRTAAAGSVVTINEDSPQGTRLVAYRDVLDYPLLLSVSVTEADALAPHQPIVRLVAGGTGLLLVFVLTATLLMVGNLRRKVLLESMLQKRDDQIRHMIQSIRDAIVTADASRRIILFNGAAESLLGVPADQAIGRDLGELLSDCLRPAQRAELLHRLDEAWRSPTAFALLTNIRLQREERQLPVEISLSTSLLHGDILLTAVFRDLTESERAERELLQTNRQLRELSVSLQNVREQERTLIARELHDELGQSLTGIKLEVSWLGGHLPGEQQPTVTSIKGQIDQTIASVRRLSAELRPLVLDDLGFSAAATWYITQFSARTGVTVNVGLNAPDPPRGGAVATTLFRVLQESLTNVARHAEATSVEVRYERRGDNWMLRIADDGSGFVHDPAQRGNLGLIGMRERVQSLGGRFSVSTAPGRGTTIEVMIPVDKSTEDHR